MRLTFVTIGTLLFVVKVSGLPLNTNDKKASLVHRVIQFGNIIKSVAKHAAETVKDAVEERDGEFHVSCATCTMGVNLFMSYVQNGKTNEEIVQSVISLCVAFKVARELVCRGAAAAFVNELAYLFKNNPNITEKDACGFAIGPKCEPSDYEKRHNWTVSLPAEDTSTSNAVVPPPDGLPTARILHLSDVHLDPYYQEGANAVCGYPLCCRQSAGMARNPKNAAGKWGDYRGCDAPAILLDNMLYHIARTHEVDYIFWTGDLLPHDIYNQSKTEVLDNIKNVVEMLQNHFPNTPVFPALGNHESHPVNSFPQPEIKGEFSKAWLYDELSRAWSGLIHKPIDSKTIIKGAYYSVPVSDGLRIISINTNYCNNKNWWLLANFEDPADELEWLISELQKAEKENEKVYLLGHIPPGTQDCLRVWSRNFHSIINRFRKIIAAQFYGHTHLDEITVFYDEKNEKPISVGYIGPSITAFEYVNPSYKIYTVDGDRSDSTRMVLDAETYYTNLTEANKNGSPTWRRLYSYKAAYNMQSLLPTDWDALIQKMVKDQSLSNVYLENMHRKSDAFPACDKACQNSHICQQITAKSFDYSMCKKYGIITRDEEMKGAGIFE